MPNVVEEVKSIYLMEPFEENEANNLPKSIKKFCRGLRIVKKRGIKSLEEANEVALKDAIGMYRDINAVVSEWEGNLYGQVW